MSLVKGTMNSAAQEEKQTETKSANNSQKYPRWLEPASVVIFWTGVGATLYVCFLPSIWHFFTAALVLTYHVLWIQKKRFSVLPRRFLALIVASSAYKILYDNFVVTPKKGTGLYNWLCCAHLFFCLTYVTGSLLFACRKSEISIDDMQVFHGSYESTQLLSSRNHCGNYLLTFRQDDGHSVSFFTYKFGELLKPIQNPKELFTIYGMQSEFAECRKFLTLGQIVGTEYQSLYNPDNVEKRKKLAMHIFYVCLCITFCLYSGVFIVSQLTKPKALLPQKNTE